MPYDHRITEGLPFPLGATWDGKGVNFALFSAHATKVELCLFDADGKRELERIELPEYTDEVWHVHVAGLPAGTVYGYRVHGPFEPEAGQRFNPHKLLLDPYAKAHVGALSWHPSLFGYTLNDESEDLSFDKRDSAPHVPKCQVVDQTFNWTHPTRIRVPWDRTIVYETHVRGYTKRHPAVPPNLRGTFDGLAQKAVVDHIRRLGVTSVELLPIHAFVNDSLLLDQGLTNYWGYNTIGFFAADPRYFARGPGVVAEFKEMIDRLHDAGLEVILDVVYNHTAEGNERGPHAVVSRHRQRVVLPAHAGTKPLLHQRYRHRQYAESVASAGVADGHGQLALLGHRDERRRLSLRSRDDSRPRTVRLRRRRRLSRQLPARSGALEREADRGTLGTAVRAAIRSAGFRRAGPNGTTAFAIRRAGSGKAMKAWPRIWRAASPLRAITSTGAAGRPWASVNLITAHDGFTLNDLVSYNERHNEANGEDNNDGHSDNRSWNCGVEGPTDDAEVRALRERQKRNLLATLLFSQGTPMLLAGDEFGRTQQGNNNAYCQDNEISWVDWEAIDDDGRALIAFVRKLTTLRHALPVLRRGRFLTGETDEELQVKDVKWLSPAGVELTSEQWDDPAMRCFGLVIDGRAKASGIRRAGVGRDAAACRQCLSRCRRVHAARCAGQRPVELPDRHKCAGARRIARVRFRRCLSGHGALAVAVCAARAGRNAARVRQARRAADRSAVSRYSKTYLDVTRAQCKFDSRPAAFTRNDKARLRF